MASQRPIWGIDIGQSALKALRCVPSDDPNKITADAFDYIEYPKILSQPEADPVELVREALETFLSRNSVKGDRVAISVPGQNGLMRFVKLPPVESKKIPDIVKFEAKQQIPFALEDVVWGYQTMAGGTEAEGFVLETEVGLFAMKREQVAKALRPFKDAGIEIDMVQLAPLSLFNVMAFDQMPDLPPPDLYDPENPGESLVVLSMGTDTTDLVVTNGFRIWQRSVPVGGNHFTKAMTKELKLTFAKAEHLKRNASHAEDAKAVFQAMRPVFSDMVTEVQRSIGFFTNIDRKAKIGRILALGNAIKLPGLQRFLAQNLGVEVDRLETFPGLEGAAVLDAPTFKENIPAFAVAYGMCLQGLRPVRVKTNLIPPEIVQERLIRSKKPWAVAAAAMLMAGLAFSFLGNYLAWNSVHKDYWGTGMAQSDSVNTQASGFVTAYNGEKDKFKSTERVGANLIHNVEGRVLWLEVLRGISAALPVGPPLDMSEDVSGNPSLQITQIECQRFEKLEDEWFKSTSQFYRNPNPPPEPMPGAPAPAGGNAADTGPKGPGWVFQLVGHHYHNANRGNEPIGIEHVYQTLIKSLHEKEINGVPVGDLGIGYATIVDPGPVDMDYMVEVPDLDGEAQPAEDNQRGAGGLGNFGIGGGAGRKEKKNMRKQPRFDFVVQFSWIETPKNKRNPTPSAPAADPVAALPAR
ncbi:MAG: type IV pilus assembly protein PilM [Pirellulales bacterium]